jgi:hypothetical protein
MKVSKILCIIIILIQFIIIIAFTTNKNTSSKNVFEETKETTKKNAGTLSFMLETSYGSGKYEKGSSTKWPLPSDGYIFNDTLSKCENGGELMWDDTKNVVLMTGNISDKCYVYFDAVQKAVINEIITSDITLSSMTITINATKGTFDISKYYYSIDNGATWNESTSNIISISGLTKGTTYAIKAYVQDARKINSDYKIVNASTLDITLITFTFMDITYYAEEGMTWEEFINSSYNTTTNNCFVPGNTPSEVACFISESRYCWPSGAKLSNQIVGGYTYESNGCEKTS